MENSHYTQASPVLPAPRASLAGDMPWECLKEKGHLVDIVESEHPDPWLPAHAVDLLIYYKNNVSGWAGRGGRGLLAQWPALWWQHPLPRLQCRLARSSKQMALHSLSLHMSDKGLHKLDQRLLRLWAGFGERGGLALRRGQDSSSRGAGGSPSEVS